MKKNSITPMIIRKPPILLRTEAEPLTLGTAEVLAEVQRKETVLKTGALQNAILNSANFSSIATDEKGVIQIFNIGAECMLGYAAADVLNKITPADISDPQEMIDRAKALSLELATTIKPGFEALVFKASRGIEDIYELTYIRKDGSRFPAIVSVTALRDDQHAIIGYLLIGTDNSARKKAEEKLSENEERFRVMFDRSAVSMSLTSPEGILLNVNEAFARMMGLTIKELQQVNLASVTHPDNIVESMECMGSLLAKKHTSYRMEMRYRHKDGHYVWTDMSTTLLRDTHDKPLYFVMSIFNISERKRAEEALLKAGALQNAIFNSANFSSIATDAKGVIQIFNVGAERMLGYKAADVINKITPADISDAQEVIARAEALSQELGVSITPGFEALVFKASRGIEDIYELTYIRKDGSRFPAVVSVTALRDAKGAIIGYLLIGTDNSARKQIEEKLRWTEESFRLMVESVTDYAIVMLDPEGYVVSWNNGAQRIKGYSAEEIVGQHFSRFYPQDAIDRGIPQYDLEAAKTIGRFEDEGWRIRKNGSTFWANVVYTSIRDQGGNLRGFAKLTRDLTERRKVEVELTDAKSLAEKANLAKSEFLSNMSHELRSPLNAILGFAQLLDSASPSPTAAQKVNIAQILKAGWHLLKLINEVLDLAVIESGKMSLSPEPVSLADVIFECEAMMEPQGQKRDITLTFPQYDIPYFVNADRVRLKQVLINLLSNAIKYNKPGGSVHVECSIITPERIRISIKDSGMGLSPDKLTQLFQPFNRLGQESSAEEGSGIGLMMSKRLIELMGGLMGVQSTVGMGSVFWFELKLVAAPQLAIDTTEPMAITKAYVLDDTLMRTLLYIEDNPANLKLVEQIIARRHDIRLISSIYGTLGIELARSNQPDEILMDINLPDINGIQALKILREDPLTAKIPVVAISANAMPHDIKKALDAGFFHYLTKPIKINEFMDALDMALEFAGKGIAQNK